MKKAKILILFAFVLIANAAYSQCTCSTCAGKGKVAVEKPVGRILPGMDEIPTKTVLESCPTCRGTGIYCPPSPPCTRTCPTCSGSGKELYNYLNGNGQYEGRCRTCNGGGKVPCN